jgi:hypothetical protein
MTSIRILGIAALVFTAAVIGGTVIGSAVASTSPGTDPTGPVAAAAPSSPPAGRADEACTDFRRAFAANLGVDESALAPAARAAAISAVNAAVADGRLPAAAADRLKARIDRADGDGCALLAGRLGRVARAAGTTAVTQHAVAAAATALGMTPADLREELRAGRSLETIAGDRGVPYPTVTGAVLGAVKADLDAAVASGRLEQARADRILDRVERNLAGGRLRREQPAATREPGS